MNKFKIIKIGLTGGMGSGKSTAAKFFAETGIPVLSADTIAREIVLPGQLAYKEILQTFGESILQPDLTIDRAKLRSIIAQNEQARKKLELITHPRIQAYSQQQFQNLEKAGEKIVIYEAPLLFEANSNAVMDAVICVLANDDLRIARIMKRDNSSLESATSLMKAQMPQSEKAIRSQYIINNNDGLDKLKYDILNLVNVIKNDFSIPS